MTLKVDKDGKVRIELTQKQALEVFRTRNTRTKEEIKAALEAHYGRRGKPNYMQHMYDLDAEFPTVDIFGPQCISAEVGPGWAKLLRPVMQALSDNACKAGQIKQKFGGLRFYWDFPDYIEAAGNEWRDAEHQHRIVDHQLKYDVPYPFEEERNRLSAIIRPIVAEAERLSFETCEECGDAITPPRGPGYRTECDDCKKRPPSGGRGSTAARG
jgi:hypothetical protein